MITKMKWGSKQWSMYSNLHIVRVPPLSWYPMLTYIEMSGQTELKYCDYVIQGDHKAGPQGGLSETYRPCVPLALQPALQHLMLSQIIYVKLNLASDFDTSGGCHFFFNDYQQWANLLYVRISLTTRENTLVVRDGEGFMLVHVLMFWGLLAQPAGRSENYSVRTHIATPENLMPFCYTSPDWTNPCLLPGLVPCGTSNSARSKQSGRERGPVKFSSNRRM